MTRALQEAAQDLTAALNEACSALATLNQINEKFSLSNEAQEAKRLSFLSARLSADTSEESARKCQEWLAETLDEEYGKKWAQANKTHVTQAMALKGRWEQSLRDIESVLSRLRDFPEAQESAERIDSLLENSRLPPAAPRPPEPAPPDFSAEPSSDAQGEEQAKQRQDTTFRFEWERAVSRAAHQKEVRKFHAERSQRTETLINQAREEAEALTRRLNL